MTRTKPLLQWKGHLGGIDQSVTNLNAGLIKFCQHWVTRTMNEAVMAYQSCVITYTMNMHQFFDAKYGVKKLAHIHNEI